MRWLLIKMIRLTCFVTLIIVMAPWAVLGSPQQENYSVVASSAILPPLPDLPIPGTQVKVIGNQAVQATPPRKEEEQAIQDTPTTSEVAPDSISSPIVFRTDRAQQLVF